MKSKVNKGICLREHKKSDRNFAVRCISVLLLFAALTALFGELGNFKRVDYFAAMAICAALFTVIYVALIKTGRKNIFYIGCLVLLFALALLLRKEVLNGAKLVWNSFCEMYTAKTGVYLTRLSTETEISEKISVILLSVCLAVVFYLASVFTVKRISVLAVIIPLLMLLGVVFTKNAPSAVCVIIALIAAVVVPIAANKKIHGLQAAFNGALCAALAVLMLLLAAMPASKQWFEDISLRMQEKYHEKKYETAYTRLPEGDLTDADRLSGKKVPALVITMENPEEMYLRGFVGCTYKDGVWTSISNETLAEYGEVLYWINSEEFNPAAQFASAVGEETEYSLITVQNIGACGSFVYAPFSVKSESVSRYIPAERLNTDYIEADGERTYVYSVVSNSGTMVKAVIEDLKNSDDENVLKYRRAESAYRQFVYDNYLSVPEEEKKLLENAFEETGIFCGEEMTENEAQENALSFLALCFGEEAAAEKFTLPLDSARGTVWQRATVGVLTLRCFGIPARYAEGYVISAELAAKAESNESITVDSACASGWIEVYQDGVGWIPLAFTPGLGEITEERQGDTANGNGEAIGGVRSETQQDEDPKTEEEDPQPDGGTLVMLSRALAWTLIVVPVLMLLLIAALILRRRAVLKRKHEIFASENINDAVCSIFADTVHMFETMKLERGNGSFSGIYGQAEERFGAGYSEKFKESYELNEMALFSPCVMNEMQRETVLDFRNDTAELLKKNEKFLKRLWSRYVRCLY